MARPQRYSSIPDFRVFVSDPRHLPLPERLSAVAEELCVKTKWHGVDLHQIHTTSDYNIDKTPGARLIKRTPKGLVYEVFRRVGRGQHKEE